MRFYELSHVERSRCSGGYDEGHKWNLPGIHCPVCDATWAATGITFPSVDLSHLPEREKYVPRVEEDYSEFERLREQVRPLVPPGVQLKPGTQFGPMDGAARGEFGPLCLYNPWNLLLQLEPLERLTAEGLQGLKGCRTQLRFRKKNPPELLEMELLPQGRLHPGCFPANLPPSCLKCERFGARLPEEPLLDAAILPRHLDLFRLADFTTLIIATERFVEAVLRLGYAQDILFRELPVR
jgi:uncharacterized double-CXXCG motif protein